MSEESKYKNALPPGFVLATGSHKYRIDSVIDAGGFGITYRATNLKAFPVKGKVVQEGAPLAIKECFLRESAKGKVYMKRRGDGYVELVDVATGYSQREAFFNEGRCLLQNLARIGSCDYTRFVPMYHAGWLAGANSAQRNYRDAGILFLVMPFLSGGTLKEYRFANPGAFVCCMYELLLTLELLHGGKVYHRDIKPSNIMLDAYKRPVLIDFGLSGETVVSRAYTKGYASPEQFKKEANVGAESDIYSLGVSFYELLMGVRPPNAQKRLGGENVASPLRLPQLRNMFAAYGTRFEQFYRRVMGVDYVQKNGAHFMDMLLYSIELAMMLPKERRFPSAAVWRNYVFAGLDPRYGQSETVTLARRGSDGTAVSMPCVQNPQRVAQPGQQRVQPGQTPVQLTAVHSGREVNPVQAQVQQHAMGVQAGRPQPGNEREPGASMGALQQGLNVVRRAGEVVQGVNNAVRDARQVANQVGHVAHQVNQVARQVNQVANVVNRLPQGLVPSEYVAGLQQGLNVVNDIGHVARGVENVANVVRGGGLPQGGGVSMRDGAQIANNVGNMLDKLNLHEAAGVARDARNVMNAMDKGKQELNNLKRGLNGLFGR